jgi:tRNA pseudouridine55 synthase
VRVRQAGIATDAAPCDRPAVPPAPHAPDDAGHEGILVVDKPVGPTSFDVVHKLRRAMGTRSLGHCGTLDPLASGVIVVCVGRYTRFVRFLTADDKRYRAQVTFGFSTPSLDLETAPHEFGDARVVDAAAVEAALAALERQTTQVPPLHSAIQKDGERLYQRARRGETVDVDPRPVEVRALRLLGLAARQTDHGVVVDADLDVDVAKGFFVRALARDLGERVGCPAHLSGLRRTRSGDFGLQDAIPLEVARDPAAGPGFLRRGPAAIRGLPRLVLDEDTARALRFGQRPATTTTKTGPQLATLGAGDDAPLVAVVDVEDGRLRTIRGF